MSNNAHKAGQPQATDPKPGAAFLPSVEGLMIAAPFFAAALTPSFVPRGAELRGVLGRRHRVCDLVGGLWPLDRAGPAAARRAGENALV